MRETTGQDLWATLGHRAEIVLSHPNRWGTEQQRFLEKAAIQAGLVTRDGAKQYLHFVEEAEAAASFALFDKTVETPFAVEVRLHLRMRSHNCDKSPRARTVPNLLYVMLAARLSTYRRML